MNGTTEKPNSAKPYVVLDRRVIVIGGHPHDVWPIVHTPSDTGICAVVLPREDRTDDTFAERARTADRIAACLNACDGINPEAVPELVLALHLIADAQPDCGMTYCQDVARAALSKTKGGEA